MKALPLEEERTIHFIMIPPVQVALKARLFYLIFGSSDKCG